MGGGRRPSVTTGARQTWAWAIPLGCAILESPSSKLIHPRPRKLLDGFIHQHLQAMLVLNTT